MMELKKRKERSVRLYVKIKINKEFLYMVKKIPILKVTDTISIEICDQ